MTRCQLKGLGFPRHTYFPAQWSHEETVERVRNRSVYWLERGIKLQRLAAFWEGHACWA
jgi:hypothetical protein